MARIDPVTNSSLPDAAESVDNSIIEKASEIDFEEIEREVGKMLILVYRDRRNVYHAQSQKLRDAYKAQIKVNADSYRNIAPIVFAVGSSALQCCSVLVVAVPQIAPKTQSIFQNIFNSNRDCLQLRRYCDESGCVNVATMSPKNISKMTNQVAKVTDTLNGVLQQIKGVKDLRDQGTRVETGAEMQHMQSLSENRSHEHTKYTQEEADAIRSFEQRRNKREDFELGMAR